MGGAAMADDDYVFDEASGARRVRLRWPSPTRARSRCAMNSPR